MTSFLLRNRRRLVFYKSIFVKPDSICFFLFNTRDLALNKSGYQITNSLLNMLLPKNYNYFYSGNSLFFSYFFPKDLEIFISDIQAIYQQQKNNFILFKFMHLYITPAYFTLYLKQSLHLFGHFSFIILYIIINYIIKVILNLLLIYVPLITKLMLYKKVISK